MAITTPAGTHYDIAMAPSAPGSTCWWRSPLAESAAKGREIVDFAAEHGLVVMCDHTYCYTPAVRRCAKWWHPARWVSSCTSTAGGTRVVSLGEFTAPALLDAAERNRSLPTVERQLAEQSPFQLFGRTLKRLADILLATIGLVSDPSHAAPHRHGVRWDSVGPAFFRQVRVGANGGPFTLFKFRSMAHGNDDSVHRSYVARYIRGGAA